MKKISNRWPRAAIALGVAATLGACASAPKNNAALDEARAAYDRAAGDAQIARSAPLELVKAQEALQQAETALRAGDERRAVEHYAYLARQRTMIAEQTDKVAQAERAVADASAQRDQILIEARTRDADRARMTAEKARAEAEAQRARALTQRGEADAARRLAEERLAAAQASQTEAERARAQAKTLADELDQLKAKQTDRGMVLTLGDVLFDTGRAELHSGAARTLDRLATFLKENPERTIQIEGHTDSTGSVQLNLELSDRRASAVKSALMDRGVAPERISARGFGMDNPVANNKTAAGRQQNRRVEIVISKKA